MGVSLAIIFCTVMFLVIITMVLSHPNSAKEVLDGPVLSYEYKCTGIILDRIKSTVRLFNNDNDKTYPFSKVLKINYYIAHTPKNKKTSITNFINIKLSARKKHIENQHYVMRISVEDKEIKYWDIKVPPDSEITPSISICEYWLSVFNRYVL
ncbi:hypothetical protein ACN4GA_24060 [Raoultella terrigena]|uniref:hypothetical protein n=1 Tax=Klebsiella grimontii TaxID=2058152 RepID=UPI0015E91329|nr:hypothetical protein [Klebsiella grimontii]MBE8895356.1 hypothetical protein [Klebsiella grimontii]QLT87579.1 hypothetical protein HV252_09570 [Klebsiella grimontii]QQQ20274.1 hypothetical protein JIZ39_15435 [Klebsiella grimontii]